ncbi:hypothetical protein [Aquimarina spongiae]|uniref:Uncharacterized protein n=1 Tax=Aquimarina spongiae TaxID=570521 RepID=A0A1M6H8T8_9FLAO|nr:hypothetical protein [Aquimarina spongiae]SHJ18596.1 hypothetical protein SAMN04488508_106139 [Aquimarina spongiae]
MKQLKPKKLKFDKKVITSLDKKKLNTIKGGGYTDSLLLKGCYFH